MLSHLPQRLRGGTLRLGRCWEAGGGGVGSGVGIA